MNAAADSCSVKQIWFTLCALVYVRHTGKQDDHSVLVIAVVHATAAGSTT